MLPINGAIYGALFAAGSRLVRGEVEVSDELQERLGESRQTVEELSELVGNLSPTRPGTWGQFAGRLMDHAFDTKRRYDSARDARRSEGFDATVSLPEGLASALVERQGGTLLHSEDSFMLVVVELNDGVTACVEIDNSGRNNRLYYRGDDYSRSQVEAAIRDAFWHGLNGLHFDCSQGRVCMHRLDLERHQYYGEHLQLIDRWRAFRESGIRRNILLQGPPGCGKTTLCCHAARELSDRVMLATSELVSHMSLTMWTDLLELLEPQVLIVDDIDRLGSSRGFDMEAKLSFFEEGVCHIPIVLFTSNDHTRLPAAMRRPGRIDQIISFDEPNTEVRRRIIGELAGRENVEVPVEEMPRLLEVFDKFSSAHVVEVLRRARVCGWVESREDDLTFRLQREFDSLQDWLRIHGYRRFQSDADFVLEEVFEMGDAEIAYEDERDRLFRVELPNGARICFEDENRGHCCSAYYRDKIDGRKKLCDGIADVFWNKRKAVVFDTIGHDQISCQSLELSQRNYYGPLVDCIDRWKAFREGGHRRNVLIQGPPGCGKSTFCLQAARELSERTVMLTPDYYDNLRCGVWSSLTDLLQPEMVIIDDIDRVGGHSLESKLRLFEEGYCDIPFVLFTSNDHSRLPEPMRRPGRIDQIIEVEPPTRELRWKLIDEMARREGLDGVPEEQLPVLDKILDNQSTAHLVEALRRAKILGWDIDLAITDGDATFASSESEDEDKMSTVGW